MQTALKLEGIIAVAKVAEAGNNISGEVISINTRRVDYELTSSRPVPGQ
jgi:lipopolysaccharide export system protein LptA